MDKGDKRGLKAKSGYTPVVMRFKRDLWQKSGDLGYTPVNKPFVGVFSIKNKRGLC